VVSTRKLLATFALSGAALTASAAHAAAPVFSGQLGVYVGSVAAESGPFGDGTSWSFWKFLAPFMNDARITVTPLDPDLDAFVAVWYGVESSTGNYFDMVSDSLNTTWVTSADAAGMGASETVRFRNDFGNAFFTLAIADYADGVGTGQLAYQITTAGVGPVPEPEMYVLLLAGLGLVAGVARMRSRRPAAVGLA